MFDTFRYTLLGLVRSVDIMIWSLLFPLVMSTVFMMMFGPLDEMGAMEPLRVVVVEPDDSLEGHAFDAFIEGASEGEGALLDVTLAADAAEADALVRAAAGTDDPYVGYVMLDGGEPRAFVTASQSGSDLDDLEASVLTLAMDEYAARAHLAANLLADDPLALADPAVAASLFEPVRATVQMAVTENQPKESVRYYFALLGMAALFAGGVGLAACQRLKPNCSALGARRAVGAVSHGRAVGGTLLASWALSFACLTVAYGYMRVVAGVDFAGRDGLCLATVAVASLMATSLGCAISALPHVPEDGKNGILTGVVCFASLFAGLYGQPTMQLADTIAASFPAAELVNPAVQVAQAFYSIMYYDSLGPWLGHIAVLAAMAAVLFLLSAHALRRQRYASI